MKNILLIILMLCFTVSSIAQSKNDTFSVYFDLDVRTLSQKAKHTLDSLNIKSKFKKNVPVAIVGYADYLATDEYNLELSRQRAINVKEYMKSFGVDEKRIRIVIGRGEVKRKDTIRVTRGVAADRRVDIVMEYVKAIPKKDFSGDTVISMHPGDKLIVPPKSTDEDFDIAAIPTGRSFILNKIFFPMGRHFPRESSMEELNLLLAFMKEYPHAIIRIEGHVCCISNIADAYDLDSHQLDLSLNRARFIYEYLKARGIAAERLEYQGYGKSRPIVADEQTLEDASRNRRVEIRILSK